MCTVITYFNNALVQDVKLELLQAPNLLNLIVTVARKFRLYDPFV